MIEYRREDIAWFERECGKAPDLIITPQLLELSEATDAIPSYCQQQSLDVAGRRSSFTTALVDAQQERDLAKCEAYRNMSAENPQSNALSMLTGYVLGLALVASAMGIVWLIVWIGAKL